MGGVSAPSSSEMRSMGFASVPLSDRVQDLHFSSHAGHVYLSCIQRHGDAPYGCYYVVDVFTSCSRGWASRYLATVKAKRGDPRTDLLGFFIT